MITSFTVYTDKIKIRSQGPESIKYLIETYDYRGVGHLADSIAADFGYNPNHKYDLAKDYDDGLTVIEEMESIVDDDILYLVDTE